MNRIIEDEGQSRQEQRTQNYGDNDFDGVRNVKIAALTVVLGALLLAALTLIFNDTVIPRITQEIESLFS